MSVAAQVLENRHRPVYIGRQPILDRDQRTVGYELLFRNDAQNRFNETVDGDTATANVIARALLDIGLERLVGHGRAFLNLTDHFLSQPQLLDCLPVERCVLEVLETVQATPEVVDGLRYLKARGFTIALDDFVRDGSTEPLLELADLIKYDVSQHPLESLPAQIARDHAAGRTTLAERVETLEEFEALRDMGFERFQGYFFARPTVLEGAAIPTDRLAIFQLLALMNRPEVSFEKLAEATTREVSVSVRALRFVNSPMTGLAGRVTSIKQALILLGRDTIRNWVTLLVMAGMEDKPAEVTSMALVRARFCQLVARAENRDDEADYFTIGMLSLLDVVMELPMKEVLSHIAAPPRLQEVLLEGKGHAGETLAAARMLERTTDFTRIAPEEMPSSERFAHWQDALLWSEETKRNIPRDGPATAHTS